MLVKINCSCRKYFEIEIKLCDMFKKHTEVCPQCGKTHEVQYKPQILSIKPITLDDF